MHGSKDLEFKDITDKILSSFYAVYNELGYGFLEKIYENAMVFVQTINKLKPVASKGTYVLSIGMSSTMSPGIKIDPKLTEE